ncbi:AMIN-like domain-containing (lipo)protein [Rhodococcus triatomae]|nr:hypothetical protein G419_20920 [Rhodococcus triatomae BKS 15-14]
MIPRSQRPGRLHPVRAIPLVLLLSCTVLACSPDRTGNEQGERDIRCRHTDSWSGSIAVGRGDTLSAPTTLLEPGDGIPSVTPPPPVLDEVVVDVVDSARERVDYVFTGDGVIGWSARYVSVPLTYGDGHEVSVAGSCVLQVDFTLADATATTYANPQRLTPPTTTITEVVTYPPHDGVVQSFVGLRDTEAAVTVDGTDGSVAVTTGG